MILHLVLNLLGKMEDKLPEYLAEAGNAALFSKFATKYEVPQLQERFHGGVSGGGGVAGRQRRAVSEERTAGS